ncbi:MAG: GNAT family N-acetyltransferase [Bacilli bacterium]|nr:GNAT family N-acetyltransferase [Bacilli bacterium]
MISKNKQNMLEEKQLAIMADCMSSAFINHANFKTIISSPKRRKKAMYHLFYMMYKVINQYGYIYEIKEQVEVVGYITFMDASDPHQISVRRVFDTKGMKHFIRFLCSLKPREMFMFWRYMKTYQAYHKQEKHESTIHLYSTGIKEQFQGKGLFKSSLRDTVSYFKKMGYQKMILETSDQTNVVLYQSLGFTITEQLTIKKSNQQIYFFALILQ